MLSRSFLQHTKWILQDLEKNIEQLLLIHMPIYLINENEIFRLIHVVMTE